MEPCHYPYKFNVATMGLSLTIPLAIVSDLIFKKWPTPGYIGGSLLVIAGFIIVNLTDQEREQKLLAKVKNYLVNKCNCRKRE